MNYFLDPLKTKYADFSGRARRKEYWMFSLFAILFGMIAATLDAIIGSYGIIYSLYGLAILLPSLAISVRRLHDINKSGWWLLISFIPLIGGIWLLVLLCTAGTVGSNQYGSDPKNETLEIDIEITE
ncbi:DUF805 domain-containing protein [Bacteroidales bacterium OttesenSCG-928-M06]|nr:DUF805 domain-containing protein [Bacteroidales bacterium OttesenSCG-928-M06]